MCTMIRFSADLKFINLVYFLPIKTENNIRIAIVGSGYFKIKTITVSWLYSRCNFLLTQDYKKSTYLNSYYE